MERLTIADMSQEQLAEVFDANQSLQSEVMDDMAESEMFWIGEQLDELRPYLSSWSIGQCNRNQHITVKDGCEIDFIEAVDGLQKSYGVFGYTDERELINAMQAIEELGEMDDEDDDYQGAQYDVDERAQDIAESLCAHYTKLLDDNCLDDDNARAYFREFYADCRMDGDEYVILDDDGGISDWTLHKDVSYTKTWAV